MGCGKVSVGDFRVLSRLRSWSSTFGADRLPRVLPSVIMKNALFAGSDGGAEHCAFVASVIETCKLNDVDPLA